MSVAQALRVCSFRLSEERRMGGNPSHVVNLRGVQVIVSRHIFNGVQDGMVIFRVVHLEVEVASMFAQFDKN